MSGQHEQQVFHNLEHLSYGEQAVVLRVEGPALCACRLRTMGLCEGASICILHQCDPVIVQCDQTRMAICRSLMKHIAISKRPDPAMP